MSEVVTYIRCQINGKWTNLGIIAEENEINEHFEFVEGLLKQKERADELEREKNEAVLALFNQKDYYGKLVDEEKQRAERFEKNWNELKDRTIETYTTLIKEKSVLAQYFGSILCVMDELEGKENVFETLQRLEGDGE